MALQQPTAIYPDARNGLGQGTVDAAQDLTVSWRVNGASAMTAFSITIYQNDAESAQKYTTGRITDGCPFFGTTPEGEIRFFSHTISAAALEENEIVNGGEYKLVIEQWWSDDDSVTQNSASAFITRDTPGLSVEEIGTINARFYTFTGNYTQEQGDVLNWFRWRIAYADNTENPFFDTGNISGTMDISAYYDGFFTGSDYAVLLTVQTENGVEASTGWVSFSVLFDVEQVEGLILASCVRGTNAVSVKFSGVVYAPGTAAGDYTIDNGTLDLPPGSSVEWNGVNGGPMSLAPPWSVLCKAAVNGQDVTLWTLGQEDGDLSAVYAAAASTLTIYKGDAAVVTARIDNPLETNGVLTAILTPDRFYFRWEYLTGGLYPSSTRYPSETLYPRADTESAVQTEELSVDYAQEAVTSAKISGPARFNYFEIMYGAPGEQTVNGAIMSGTYDPDRFGDSDYLNANFQGNGLSGGNLNIGIDDITGYALYRRDAEGSILTHVADVAANVREVYDYGVKSRNSYIYYLFPMGKTTYITNPMPSNAVAACFSDWSVIEGQKSGTKNVWNVLAEYRFGNNLMSGMVSNNNRPVVSANFTRYPTVQPAAQNYRSGTLQSLIGYVKNGVYSDSASLMEKIFALSTTANDLFLKDRKGNLMKIRISDVITMQAMDGTREQAQSVSLPWVEVADTEGMSLVSYGNMVQRS